MTKTRALAKVARASNPDKLAQSINVALLVGVAPWEIKRTLL